MKYSICFAVLVKLVCVVVGNVKLEGNFKECMVGTKLNMVKFDNDCFRDTENNDDDRFEQVFTNKDKYFPAFIFSKHNFILESKGFECKLIIHKFRFSKDFLFNKYIQKDILRVKLSKNECLTMAKDKECGKYNDKKQMKCNKNNDCSFVDEISEEFPFYFGTVEKNFYECHISERIVQAQNLNVSIFHGSQGPCYAEDEVCFFEENTIVWDKNDIRTCQFERILELPFLELKPFSKSSIFFTKKQDYLFKLKKKEIHCGKEFYLTTEGVYLAFYLNDQSLRTRLLDMKTSKFNINHFIDTDRNDLIIAENDFQRFLIYKLTMNLACSMIMNTIQANINNDDTFLHLNYLGEKDLILYMNSGKVFVPTCVNVSTIIISNNTNNDNCDRDIEISYLKNDSSKRFKGYLRANNLITQFSTKRENCARVQKSIVVTVENRNKYSIIKRKDNILEVLDFNVQTTDFRIDYGNLVNLYNHHDYLVNGSSFYEKINEYFEPKDTVGLDDKGSNNFFGKDDKIWYNEPFKGLKSGLQDFLENTKKSAYLISLFVLIFLCILFFLIKYIQRKSFKISLKDLNFKKPKNNELKFLDPESIQQDFLLND
ncbi:unnamed protein product [Brachionus calyciflorus]|uniref:Uncharacterized protein n=1 Tax=Brachionus calyciflorus TaxID=104777 RepID=A0A813THE1_9BILA|nr:unnamed protein product [Brachionus calyciflorus]